MIVEKSYNLIRQLTIIFGVCLAADFIAYILPFKVPANILGMVLLFCLLYAKIIKVEQIDGITNFLLQNMAFFFIATAISLMDSYVLIKNVLLIFLGICFFSTIVTFAVTAYTVTFIRFLQRKFLASKTVKEIKEDAKDA